jgi:hypothetical protein
MGVSGQHHAPAVLYPRGKDLRYPLYRRLKYAVQKQERTSTPKLRFEIPTAASMKMAVFWVVAPCSLVEVYRRFRGTCSLHHQGDDDGGSKYL